MSTGLARFVPSGGKFSLWRQAVKEMILAVSKTDNSVFELLVINVGFLRLRMLWQMIIEAYNVTFGHRR
jgi:hypothetical protein